MRLCMGSKGTLLAVATRGIDSPTMKYSCFFGESAQEVEFLWGMSSEVSTIIRRLLGINFLTDARDCEES